MLLLSIGDVDGSLSFSFRSEDLSTFVSLSLSLQDHRVLNRARRVDILNFVSEGSDAPLFSLFLDTSNDICVQVLTFDEGLVKSEFTNLGSHCSLSKVDDSLLVIFNVIGSLLGVFHLDVQTSVNVESHVVFGDSDLGVDIDELLSEVNSVLHGVDDRNQEIQARAQLAIKLLKSVAEDCVFLTHDHVGA